MLIDQALSAKEASKKLAQLSTAVKNRALEHIADALLHNVKDILEANRQDMETAEKARIGAMLDRLMLNEGRIKSIADDVLKVAGLKDYIGDVMEERTLPNGINLQRVRVPLGVVGAIIESRPNVTVDIATLCLKSGNAVFLKGGSDAISSNRVLVRLMKEALGQAGLPFEAIQFVDSTDRAVVSEFLQLKYIDLMVPRGGQGLVDFVMKNATMPVLGAGGAVVHVFVDKFADVKKALDIVVNSKTRRVSVCNALDNLLVHKDVVASFLPKLAERLKEFKVEIRADEAAYALLDGKYPHLKHAVPSDWNTEYLDYVMGVRIIDSIDAALEHIEKHSLRHTEAIVTEDSLRAERFLKTVDAACVYHNISTQFSDGAQFGLGAEVAISTQKLHARGPFALEGLTTYKWILRGEGQIRQV